MTMFAIYVQANTSRHMLMDTVQALKKTLLDIIPWTGVIFIAPTTVIRTPNTRSTQKSAGAINRAQASSSTHLKRSPEFSARVA